MSALSVMQAMGPVLTNGTNIQVTVIESSLDVLAGAFPAIILSCPRSIEERKATGKKGELHTIHVQYLDVWDSSTRGVAQMTQDARTVLEQMKANMRASKTLSGGVISAGERMETDVEGVITAEGLPRPLFGASLVIDVADQWFTA